MPKAYQSATPGRAGADESEHNPRHAAFELEAMMDFANAPELAREHGIAESALSDRDAMIPIGTLHTFIEAAAEASGDPLFGARFAAFIGRRDLPKRSNGLALLAMSSPSVLVALEQLVRYQHVYNEADSYEVVEEGSHTHIVFDAWGPPRLAQAHMAEKTLFQILLVLGLAEEPVTPVAIHFAHEARPGTEALVELFGQHPAFGRERTAVVCRTGDLHVPLAGSNPLFWHFFERHLRETVGERSPESKEGSNAEPKEESWERRARDVIAETLHTGTDPKEELSQRLGLSVRSIQRRLRAEGSSLSELTTEIRYRRAKALLTKGLTLRETALLTGYSSATAFARAFRSWTGTTPKRWVEDPAGPSD